MVLKEKGLEQRSKSSQAGSRSVLLSHRITLGLLSLGLSSGQKGGRILCLHDEAEPPVNDQQGPGRSYLPGVARLTDRS